MKRNYVSLDVDDPRASLIADVLANKSCKKILGLLAERDLSESELSSELKIPLTTVGYNVKKLISAGLIERKRSLWSSRGKMVPTYRVSNKSIVISPRTISSRLLPALVISGLAAIGINYYLASNMIKPIASEKAADALYATTSISAPAAMQQASSTQPNLALWFFAGALVCALVYALLSKVRFGSLK